MFIIVNSYKERSSWDLNVVGPQGQKGDAGAPGAARQSNGGVTYVMWGKNSCPSAAGTELLYSGYMAGSDHSQKGGGTNFLCMPTDPDYTLPYKVGYKDKLKCMVPSMRLL